MTTEKDCLLDFKLEFETNLEIKKNSETESDFDQIQFCPDCMVTDFLFYSNLYFGVFYNLHFCDIKVVLKKVPVNGGVKTIMETTDLIQYLRDV